MEYEDLTSCSPLKMKLVFRNHPRRPVTDLASRKQAGSTACSTSDGGGFISLHALAKPKQQQPSTTVRVGTQRLCACFQRRGKVGQLVQDLPRKAE
ncbi:hypothetical protein HPB47_023557 [Ixodes persulcatus]|uniref:Uncharacterized protein n=1 Tax=Ixodes persulcatus TaxID=34615 RepID=A0AC60Q922_IXOPE|nr:hypothetical protein HPB47_023557 [Ixodes persulcatus]